jgi:predicted permease
VHELKYALRSRLRAPGFSATAVLTLALGIGAATAVFSVANGVLLRPLPYADPDEVVTVWASWDNFPDKTWLSVPEYQLLHQESRTLVDLALYGTSTTSFTSVEAPEQVGSAVVTPNLFELLGVAPVTGRTFGWGEARDGTPGVVLAHDLWERRYGGDPAIVGRDVELNGAMTPVLGVLPEGFALPVDFAASAVAEVYYPYWVDLESPAPDLGGGGSHGSYGVARLREGATVEAVRADFERVMAQVEPVGLYSPERRFTLRVYSAEADIVGSARATLLVLLGAVGLVLLIACGNVANLLLARSETRAGEVAVRTALGAGHWRIVRQLLTESAVVAVAAGVLGFALAAVGVDALLAIDPEAVPRATSVRMDGAVAAFTMAVSLLTVLVFGAVPALRVARSGLGARLRRGGRGGLQGAPSDRVQRLLVASQMAMAVILLAGSGLMMRSFVGLLRIDPGFEGGDVLTLRLAASAGRYADAPAVARFYEELLERVRRVPGVTSAGAARLLPLASTMGDSFFRPVGYEPAPNEGTQGDWQWATPGYLETMGIPLVEGRSFDERDRRDAQPVVMVNEALARRYWGDESALGRAVLASGAADTAIVVGVVGNLRHNGITGEVKGRYYVPHAQVHPQMMGTMRGMTLTVGTEGDPRRLLEAVRAEVRALDPSMPVSQVQTLDEVLSTSLAQPRFGVVLLGAFAALALGLAVIGIYGVLAYSVSRRTGEIGIRMALGARRGQVVGLVVRQGFVAALAGVALGIVLAWLLADLLAGLLYGVTPQDPTTFAAVPALLLLVSLIACWLPAVRATRVRPATALRHE